MPGPAATQPAPLPRSAWTRWRDRFFVPASAPQRPQRWYLQLARHATALLLAGVVFWACFRLHTREHDFPSAWHTDEPSKVMQIAGNTRNFNHPLLLLETVDLAGRWAGLPRGFWSDRQAVVELGRSVSAGFSAAAAAALALAAYATWGLGAMVVVGAAVTCCPALLVGSHFMKEDTALVCGIALTVLAGRLVWSGRSVAAQLAAAALLGVAVAVAVSGKYIGAAALLLAVPVLLLAPVRVRSRQTVPCASDGSKTRFAGEDAGQTVAPEMRRPAGQWALPLLRPLVFLPYLALAVAGINYRIFLQWSHFVENFQSEAAHGVTDHRGLTLDTPSSLYLQLTYRDCTWPVLACLLAYAVMLIVGWRRRTGFDYLLPLFAGGLLLIVSWSVIPWSRYVLPVVVLAYACAGLGAVWLVDALRPRWWLRGVLLAGVLGILMNAQVPRCQQALAQFRDSSRNRVRAWVLANLPARAVIAEDSYAVLHAPPDRRIWPKGGQLPQRVLTRSVLSYACELGDLDRLRGMGVTHVAVVEGMYSRYFDPRLKPIPSYKAEYDYRRAWYERLFREGKLVHEDRQPADLGAGVFVSPTIKVYELGPAPGGAPAPAPGATTAPATTLPFGRRPRP